MDLEKISRFDKELAEKTRKLLYKHMSFKDGMPADEWIEEILLATFKGVREAHGCQYEKTKSLLNGLGVPFVEKEADEYEAGWSTVEEGDPVIRIDLEDVSPRVDGWPCFYTLFVFNKEYEFKTLVIGE